MTLAELRAKLAELVAKMRGILSTAAADGGRLELNAEEQAAYDAAKAERDAVKAQIDRLVELDGFEASLEQVRPAAARGQGAVSHAPGDPAKREFEAFGQFMHAVRFNPNDQRLAWKDNLGGAVDLDPGAEMRMDTGEQGGFMVPEQFRSTLLQVSPAEAAIRPRANVIPAGTPPDAKITMPALDQTGDTPANVFGGVEVSWISEGATKPDTDATLREVSLEPQEVAATVTVTDKLLRNWQAGGPFIESLLRGAMGQAEDFAFIKGDGVGKPLGIINSGAALAVNRNTASDVKYIDLATMLAKMLMRGGNPVWIISQGVLLPLLTMKDDEGRLIFVQSLQAGVPSTLLGYPVVINNRLPGLGVKGDVQLVNAQYYLIKDGSGPFVAASEHVLFKQNKTVIKAFWNVDGQPWLTQPFTEENGYVVSPFMVLDVPA